MGTEYDKIYSPYARHVEGPLRNKLDPGKYLRPEFELLWNAPWHWTEKVDGTNIRIIWDGHRVSFAGRTDAASIPGPLMRVLSEMFPEELLEQQFKNGPAVLYGEGYGPKIQKGGGNYRQDPGFVLFDVKAGDWWLLPTSVTEVASQMGIEAVPTVLVGTVPEAIGLVREGLLSRWGTFQAEGLVGRPPLGITGRDGDRLLMKVKCKDFTGGAK